MRVTCDYLIIGSGIAALRAAIELADAGDVVMLTKAGSEAGSTGYAQGGIAAALGPDDSPERHAEDTIAAGAGLCNPTAVRLLTETGPGYVRELADWGARFERDSAGRLSLAREGAHAVRRVVHARDATGREIARALWQRLAGVPSLRVVEHAEATGALIADGECVGMRFLDAGGAPTGIMARATLLATGGAGRLFRETTNPDVATGDGIAIAYRAGARVTDLEFVQFHPTALAVGGGRRFLLSEALRGEGARLVNETGEAFMRRYDTAGDLAARDRVARGIVEEQRRTGAGVYLSLDTLDPVFVHDRFPMISQACREAGLDLACDRIPVSPAAHYVMGGVETDLETRTSLPGLFAAGETACTGVHGANRLASNSLLEGLVFGAIAGRAMRARVGAGGARPDLPAETGAASPVALPDEDVVRVLMWEDVGLARCRDGLSRALETFNDWSRVLPADVVDRGTARLSSLVTVGRLVTRAALRREESRGGHYRTDYPDRNDIDWSRHLTDSKDGDLY